MAALEFDPLAFWLYPDWSGTNSRRKLWDVPCWMLPPVEPARRSTPAAGLHFVGCSYVGGGEMLFYDCSFGSAPASSASRCLICQTFGAHQSGCIMA